MFSLLQYNPKRLYCIYIKTIKRVHVAPISQCVVLYVLQLHLHATILFDDCTAVKAKMVLTTHAAAQQQRF